MNFTGSRESITSGFRIVSHVVPSRSTRPILSNILIRAQGNELELAATDLDVGILHRVRGVEIEKPGTVLVPAQKIVTILSELRSGDIAIESDGKNLTVRTQNGIFRINGETAENYPPMPDLATAVRELKDTGLSMSLNEFLAIVRKTLFAASRERTRYATNGVLFQIRKGELRVVATDGKRLSLVTRKGLVAKASADALVPAATLEAFEKICGGRETADALEEGKEAKKAKPEDLVLHVEERRISFLAAKDTLVFSKLVEGAFPKYEEVIPKKGDKIIAVPRDGLASVLRQAALMASDSARSVRLTFADKKLRVSSQSSEYGDATVDLPLEYAGEKFEIRFDPDFLIDFLRVADAARVEFEFRDSTSAAILRDGEGSARGGAAEHVYVVMPMGLT
ncbi:MAG: DNA polymerase III subunit beta [Planctomycetota bacterium]